MHLKLNDFYNSLLINVVNILYFKILFPGKICSLVGLMDAIAPAIYAPIYNKIYENTLDYFPGMYYVVGATMTIPAFFIFM